MPKDNFAKTTEDQILQMISWLENPIHLKVVTGGGSGGLLIAVSKLKKIYGFRGLASYIKIFDRALWTDKSTKSDTKPC